MLADPPDVVAESMEAARGWGTREEERASVTREPEKREALVRAVAGASVMVRAAEPMEGGAVEGPVRQMEAAVTEGEVKAMAAMVTG